jgi:hypothetical protein
VQVLTETALVDFSRDGVGLGTSIESGLPERGKSSPGWRIIAGEISPQSLHYATVPDGPNRQWKGGAFERIEAENRRALKQAEEAEIEANGYFTDPDWKEVTSPDGVRCFVTRFREQKQRPGNIPAAPLPADLSIPEFLLRIHAGAVIDDTVLEDFKLDSNKLDVE